MVRETSFSLRDERPWAATAVAAFLIRRIALGCIAILACSCGEPTPEARLRATLERGVAAAERNDVDALRELVSPRYADAEGRGREELLARVRAYLSYLAPAHVFTIERSLAVAPDGRAEVTMLVAVATIPIESLADLRKTSADIGRVEMVFVEEDGAWKLFRASWSPAELTDFL